MTTAALAQASVHHTESLLFFTLLQLDADRGPGRRARRCRCRSASGSRARWARSSSASCSGPRCSALLAPEAFQYVFRSTRAGRR
ncbi:MAG: hypothetical protein MZW92_37775 [Comamonadaceae bacterium]|nr:hypothetical protein [Comamonadaceae bacterium]